MISCRQGVSEMLQKPNLLTKPYSDRQIILFANDDVVAAHEKTEATIAEMRKYSLSLEGYLDYFKLQIKHLDMDRSTRIMNLMQAFLSVKRSGVNIRLVPKSQLEYLSLPPGHPRDNVVYLGHPAISNNYMPVAGFHRTVFEHKLSEVISLLMHLGAKKINIKHMQGWGLEFLMQLDTGLLIAEAREEIKAKTLLDIYKLKANVAPEQPAVAPKAAEQVMIINTSQRNEQKAMLPDHLVWYQFEPTWQWVSDGRIKFGLKQFVLDLNYREDYDINLELKDKLQKAGFNLVGEFESPVATKWRIFGEFWD